MPPAQKDLLRSIPSVDKLLEEPAVLNLMGQSSRSFVVILLRKVLISFRHSLNTGIDKDSHTSNPSENILETLEIAFRQATNPRRNKVISARRVQHTTQYGSRLLGKHAYETDT